MKTKQKETKGNPAKREVKAFSIAKEENDTYQLIDRAMKEEISKESIRKHWDTRAKRPGVQTVMSARHTVEENEEATIRLQEDVFEFLGDRINGRVFELGVGVGRMTSEIAKRATKVVGCDFSPIMLQKARENLKDLDNVELHEGKILDLELEPKSFDLVFESIVLLHILSPDELVETIKKMQELSDRILVVEHTYEGPDFPISKYSILRKPEEYAELFGPYQLVKQKTHFCAGDRFTLMLFERDAA